MLPLHIEFKYWATAPINSELQLMCAWLNTGREWLATPDGTHLLPVQQDLIGAKHVSAGLGS